MYPMIYYKTDGITTRTATAEEVARDEEQRRICVQGVTDARERAKVNDISESLLFALLGAGLLITRRYVFA